MKLKNLIQKNVLNLSKFLVYYLPSALICTIFTLKITTEMS